MKKYTQNASLTSGFTLIEMSVVIAILAVAVAGALQFADRSLSAGKLETTKQRIEEVANALQKFAKINGYLPCPGSLSSARSDDHFGLGNDPSSTNSTDQCNTATWQSSATAGTWGASSVSNNHYIAKGSLPVGVLELPITYMFDGWGRRFTYVVDTALTNPAVDATENSTYFNYAGNIGANGVWDGGSSLGDNSGDDEEPAYSLIVVNIEGDEFPITHPFYDIAEDENAGDGVRGRNPAFVLVSHGKNGHGAYRYDGQSTVTHVDAGEPEEQNADNNERFEYSAYNTEDDGGGGSYYDDIITFRTIWNMQKNPHHYHSPY